MSSFDQALSHYAEQAHGIEKLNCLRAALLTHQVITTATSGQPDAAIDSQIKKIEAFLQGERLNV